MTASVNVVNDRAPGGKDHVHWRAFRVTTSGYRWQWWWQTPGLSAWSHVNPSYAADKALADQQSAWRVWVPVLGFLLRYEHALHGIMASMLLLGAACSVASRGAKLQWRGKQHQA